MLCLSVAAILTVVIVKCFFIDKFPAEKNSTGIYFCKPMLLDIWDDEVTEVFVCRCHGGCSA